MGKLETAFIDALRKSSAGDVAVRTQAVPAWLVRPGRDECRGRWDLVQEVYARLTGLALPEVMPSGESRRLDALLTYPDGAQRVLEIDETQHFNSAATLDYYNERAPVAFDVATWREMCDRYSSRRYLPGYTKPRPPLFPDEGGRQRQRAFRDFLADALPPLHGWLPTIRVSHLEARAVVRAGSMAVDELLARKMLNQ